MVFKREQKVRLVASDLAQAMRRRYGPEAESVCSEALARRELIGARRHITRLALQILTGTSHEAGARGDHGPFGLA